MRIALLGNPNSGKTSLFNQLTGLNQKVGNYPGVTVEKKIGKYVDPVLGEVEVLDLPGTYSLYPHSEEEKIVHKILLGYESENAPKKWIVVVDATNIERNLLLATQIIDLQLPVILALNMTDIVRKNKIRIDIVKLSELLGGIPVVSIVAKTGEGLDQLRTLISQATPVTIQPLFDDHTLQNSSISDSSTDYSQATALRYKKIKKILSFCIKYPETANSLNKSHLTADKILTHKIWGYVIFAGILLLIFQSIYAWAEWPMELIDKVFLSFSQQIKNTWPTGPFTSLVAEGILPGLGGVLIFIPQIALLFTFIFLMEETGYMSRVVFIMDRLMRPFGLNGKSVVPLISGVACAIPAVMATRTISNWKERMVTIMVTPLISCSARLPVFTLLIALVIPDSSLFFFNLQGLVLFGLYLLGILAAIFSACVFSFFIKTKEKSYLVMEMPLFKMPRWNNLLISLVEKIKIFVWEAGRIIMAISIVLWFLASYGPANAIETAESTIPVPAEGTSNEYYEHQLASARLSASYIGHLGHFIAPVLEPLGYNWQIGIALITSFAAREVFVGSMATIYSVGENFEENKSLLQRMQEEKNSKTGVAVYNLASGISLMLFYAFAMQCMSTLAIVYRETHSLKWPLIQLLYMTSLAYLSAFAAYQLLA